MDRGAAWEQRTAYLLLRVLTGINFFGHGFARIATGTHLSGFAHGMLKNMSSTPLPPVVALAAGYAIPVLELTIGVLLVFGIRTREALLLAMGLMCLLMAGITLKQDWTVASEQLIYGLVLCALLFGRDRFEPTWRAWLRP